MDVSTEFKLALLVVVGLTVVCLVGIGILALFGSQATDLDKVSIGQRNFHTACSFGWQAGVGAIFGLVGGKATA